MPLGLLGKKIGMTQLFDEKPERKVNKPEAGHFAKSGAKATRILREVRGAETKDVEVGQTLSVEIFAEGETVDVVGTTKGRGFTSVRKRHGSKPGPKSHGSMYINRPGSMGGSSEPARTFPGKPSAGHYGTERVTAKTLTVVKTDASRNLILVKGSIPGANGNYVLVRKGAVKAAKAAK